MRKKFIAHAGLLIVFTMPIIARGQVTATPQQAQNEQTQQMSPEKKALIRGLMDIVDVKKSSAQVLKVMFDQMDQQRIQVLWQALVEMKDFNTLTEAEREHMRSEIKETTEQNTKRFLELFDKRLDFGAMSEEIFMDVYAKHFNEQELKDVVAFYQSATGKKSLEIAPVLLAESMSEAGERMVPVIKDVVNEMSIEDSMRFQKEVTSLAKAHHRTATARTKARRR
jgi:hypothetical protein